MSSASTKSPPPVKQHTRTKPAKYTSPPVMVQRNGAAVRSAAVANGHVARDADETSRLLPNGPDEEYDKPVWDGLTEFEHLPFWRRPSIFWLMGPYAIFTLAFGGVIVPKVTLILDLVCNKHFADKAAADPSFHASPVLGADNPQCNDPAVQRKVAEFMLVMNLLTGTLSAISAPKLGKLSDRFGRRRLLAVASVGGILAEVVTIVAAKFPAAVDYRWLVLGAFFDGLTGSFTSGSILGQAYVSDCTPPSKRAVYMGYLHACLFTGIALGPLLAGYFIKVTGSVLTLFYVVLVCHATFATFVGFVVPESLSARRQRIARDKHSKERESRAQSAQPWLSTLRNSHPFEPLAILWPTGPGTSPRLRINLIALAVTDAVIMGSMISIGAVVILYTKYMFDWDTFEISMFVSGLSSIRVIVLLGVFPLVNYWFRVRPRRRRERETGLAYVEKTSGADNVDIWTLRAALLSDTLGAIGYSLAHSQPLFVVSGMITAVGGLGSATIQSAITKHVPPSSVGQVLGAVGMLNALARVVGPVLFNGIYAMSVKTFPQAVFVMLLALFSVGLLATLVVRPHVVWEHENEAPEAVADETPEAGTLALETEPLIR
ncbi:tetracycline-efflux transporter, putative [Cordyceps militaris CM01]|uniref:Tetracycline-efflux transporter, putative n=1 Tax=Cordyceps militaris (strain CM01) TaxID=983644 RepID=G3JE84_CORMM|nr:tetracycline-efflux transporter, putative [Cordyceps militaris CM01]EGX92909.1 tetracycline-efflux transporter, putative [Cordyceps militaris CM01]